ncbi:uncharacterized protein BKA55DRAFT_377399 [Fusarium redolens]|uniref:Uncharacterized protein n=1 Tax=Fusarium redolens TaxID=48865 RepID=A0A9P9KAN2_FUSRE|nr:uncharacterized protein BKA55DRAFT_377399 [Fusarium redolens]KAH7250305.1 hypothetical protein BKA55DRAFT_377399 [Fusarium redolens]
MITDASSPSRHASACVPTRRASSRSPTRNFGRHYIWYRGHWELSTASVRAQRSLDKRAVYASGWWPWREGWILGRNLCEAAACYSRTRATWQGDMKNVRKNSLFISMLTSLSS